MVLARIANDRARNCGPRCRAARARSSSAVPPGMRLLTKWMTCSLTGGLPVVAGGRCGLRLGQRPQRAIREPLRPVAPVDHHLARQLDGPRIGRVQEQHGRRGARIEALLAHAAQQVAHGHRDVAEVDVDRAGRQAFVADGAMIGDVRQFVPMLDRHAAPRLLLVEERLDQQRGREDLVARASTAGWRAARGSRIPACICRSAGNP